MSGATAQGDHYAAFRRLLLFFFELDSLGFGGAIATFGYLRRELVERPLWLPTQGMLDGIALGGPCAVLSSRQVAMWSATHGPISIEPPAVRARARHPRPLAATLNAISHSRLNSMTQFRRRLENGGDGVVVGVRLHHTPWQLPTSGKAANEPVAEGGPEVEQ
jgi:Chromate transporter